MPPCAFKGAHWARATRGPLLSAPFDRSSEPQLSFVCVGVRSVRMDPFGRSLLLTRVSDQLSDHDRAEVGSAMRLRTRWRIWSRTCPTWSRSCPAGVVRSPVLVAFPMEIGARVAAATVITTATAVTALKIWGDQVVVPGLRDGGLEIASLSTKKGPRSCEN
jgi:hypothetical protein